jgi:hypothetical protein
MLDLNNVTIACVACVRVEESLRALKYSMKNINFSNAKLFTDIEIEAGDDIEIVKIDKLDYPEYNRFIVFELHKYIDTDYCLIIQDDGYVINSDGWRNEFLEYDYIGAPWGYNPYFKDVYGNIVNVGNGGFSLRSKKLLEEPTNINLTWCSYDGGYWNEDGFICIHNRHHLEDAGCKFAPIDVAKYFSHENEIPITNGIKPFGFHGKSSRYLNENKILE